MRWHALAIQALGAELQSDPERGLEPAEAAKLFLRQFGSLIVRVLIGAALVSGLLQEWVDAAAYRIRSRLNYWFAAISWACGEKH